MVPAAKSPGEVEISKANTTMKGIFLLHLIPVMKDTYMTENKLFFEAISDWIISIFV